MKKILSTTSALILACITLAQVPTFKWVDGSQDVRGTETLIKTTPGPRQGASSYVDDEGNFWLFGGFGHDFTEQAGYLNDVWKYDTNAESWVWMNGQMAVDRTIPSYNNSLQFDGVDDKIDLPQDPVAYNVGFTVELWFRTSVDGALISWSPSDHTSSNDGWGLEIVNSGESLWIRKGFSVLAQATGLTLTDNNWHHVALVFEEGDGLFVSETMTTYIDGEETSSGNVSFTFSQNPNNDHITMIGTYQGNNDQIFFTGEMDEVRFWNYARNGGEIKSNYTIQLTGNEEGLAAYYDFNQGVANGGNNLEGSLLDLTPNANHGALGDIYREGIYLGKMAEVRMWTTLLTPSDIYDIANRPVVDGEANLHAFYDFTDGIPEADNTAVTTLADGTTNNLDGTLQNFALIGTSSNFQSEQLGLLAATYTTFYGARNVIAEDFTGDGYLDLLSETSDGIMLMINDQTGQFGTATEFAIGTTVRDITVGHFNGDAFLDVAGTAWNSGTDDQLYIFFGDGAGNFPTNLSIDLDDGSRPMGIASGFVDGDANLDILISLSLLDDFMIFYGDGAGNFNTSITIDAPPFITDYPLLEDFNGDGFADIVTNVNDGGIWLATYINDGTGSFGEYTRSDNQLITQEMSVADVNQDGNKDIIYAYFNQLGVILGNGDATFGDAIITNFNGEEFRSLYPLGVNSSSGNFELMASLSNPPSISLMELNDDFGYETLRNVWTGEYPGQGNLAIGDFDQNGFDDIAIPLNTNATKVLLKEQEAFLQDETFQVLEFDGVDDHIEIPDLRPYSADFSWEGWILPFDNGPIFSFTPTGTSTNWEAGGTGGFSLAIKEGKLTLLIEGQTEIASGAEALIDGHWHHVALVVDVDAGGDEYVQLYIDGQFNTSGYRDFDGGLAVADMNYVSKLGYATVDFANVGGSYGQAPGSNWADGAPFPAATDGRAYAAEWINGDNIYIFGGEGNDGIYNSIRQFNTVTNSWTTVKGSDTPYDPGDYGTLDVASSSNVPPARWIVDGTLDPSGDFWVFGGAASQDPVSWFNDLWVYDTTNLEWTWKGGTNGIDELPVYGTQGVSDPTNVPGARENNQIWSDASGNIWVFGGYGIDKNGAQGFLNDLWRWDPTTMEWTWLAGSDTVNQGGVYGELGQYAPDNYPGARAAAIQWQDSNGLIWIFGGQGYDKFGVSQEHMNDLWSYDPATEQWAWHAGSDFANSTGSYNETGLSSTDYVPGARWHASEWLDSSGNLWLFGGFLPNQITTGRLNDFWKYEPTSGEWTWLSGENSTTSIDDIGTYGDLNGGGKPFPGARHGGLYWTDPAGDFWMLGGALFGSSRGLLTDLWKYEPDKREWTFIRGNSDLELNEGVYGAQGIGSPTNEPKSRWHGASWLGDDGRLWFFGGLNHNGSTNTTAWLNDLWVYDPASDIYTWMGGSSDIDGDAVYGIQGEASAAHIPGAKSSAAYWKDSEGNFWLFGGYESFEYNNDLWKFNPNTLEWTWVNGNNFQNTPGTHGELGVAAESNEIGARRYMDAWIDPDENIWIFGGQGVDSQGQLGYLNDLWKYNPSTNLWTWMGGPTIRGQIGNYGSRGIASPDNYPSARYAHTTWTDDSGNLWLFGGVGILGEDQATASATWLNDLWKYDIRTNMWTWIAGNGPDAVQDGTFGTQGVFDENNLPFARERTQKFETTDKSLFFFGGRQSSANTRNDFWEIKFTPGETFVESPSELLQTEFTFAYDEPWAETYQIQVALSSDFSDVFYDQVSTETNVTIENLVAGTNYFYRINAINEIGTSGFGDTQSTLTLPATPEFESLSLAVTNIASTTASVNWLVTPGVLDGFEIDISTDPSFADEAQFLAGYEAKVLSVEIIESVTGLAPGTNYYVRLRSFNSSGFSPYSETLEFLTTPETPAYDATEVISEIGQNAASIVWNPVPEILNGYRLTVSTDPSFADAAAIVTDYDARGVPKDRNSIPIIGLTPGTQYYAYLTAFNTSGESTPSSTISILTLPESPVFAADASILAATQTSMQITWTAPAEIFDGYELEVSTDFSFNNANLMLAGYGRGGIPKTIDKFETVDLIQNLDPGETYYARIRSYNSSGESPNSNIIELITVPSAPEFNPVGNIKQESASLSWSVTDGTETYLLDLNTSENFESSTTVLMDFPLAVPFRALTDLTPGTRYYARVQSSNVSGSSGTMNPPDYDSTTFITIPANPVLNEPDQIGQTSIRVSWPDVVGAASYEVDVSDNFFQTFLVGYIERLVFSPEIIIEGLDPGSEYQIRVRSKNVTGESDEATNLDLLTIPATPIARDATNSSANVFTANWDPVSGAEYYVLEVSIDDFQTFHYNEQLGSSNPVQISNLTASETYQYRVRSGNASGESPNSDVISIVAQNTAQSLSISSVEFDEEFGETTTSLPITVTLSGGLANPEVSIRHRRILNSSWSDLLPMTAISETQFEFEITSLMLDELGVEFEIYANDQVTFIESLGNLIKRTFSETNSEALPALNLGEWQMISIPYVLDDDLVTSIFNELGNLEYKKKWRLMSYIGEEYQDQGVGFTRIELGRGYWFNSLTDVTINVGAGQTNGVIPFQLALEQGWNQIGNPYNVTIDWNNILNENGLSTTVDRLIVYNTTLRDFESSNTLDAFEGAFVWSDQAVVVPIDPMAGSNGRISETPEEFSGSDWKKELKLNWNGTTRPIAAIGMHGSAAELKDTYDKLTVPRFENYLEMYTTNQEYFYPYFSEDIQPHAELKVWNFNLESNYVAGLVELGWNPEVINGNLWLLDERTGSVVNMSSTNSYTLNLSGSNQLSIHFSTDPNYNPIPQNFILGDIYPNPISARANIPLLLPEDAHIELNLYNLNGMKVKQIAKGSYPAGIHLFNLDAEKEELQDGIYLIRLSSDQAKSTHKKILIRH